MHSRNQTSAGKTVWLEVMDWLKIQEAALPPVWPPEFPPEETPDFWFTACRFEMMTRQEVSARLRILIAGGEMGIVRPLEAWLFRRRFEWGGQMALGSVTKRLEPAMNLPAVLEWILIDTWASNGCISMWKHAERGGKPHPKNPDGLTPLAPHNHE